MRSFVTRVVVGAGACPYTKSADVAATGLAARGVTPGPVACDDARLALRRSAFLLGGYREVVRSS